MRLFRTAAGLVVLGALAANPVHAQQATPAPASSSQDQHQHAPPQTGPGMMDHDRMMADMKAADAKLQQLRQAMQSAKGDDRIRAMQDLLSQLVQDQMAMHAHMAMMHDHMMGQMQMPSGSQPVATPGQPATPR